MYRINAEVSHDFLVMWISTSGCPWRMPACSLPLNVLEVVQLQVVVPQFIAQALFFKPLLRESPFLY